MLEHYSYLVVFVSMGQNCLMLMEDQVQHSEGSCNYSCNGFHGATSNDSDFRMGKKLRNRLSCVYSLLFRLFLFPTDSNHFLKTGLTVKENEI